MNSTNTDNRCPACDAGSTTGFFLRNRPVDVGRLFPSESDARDAPVGVIDLGYCASCGFVHNRKFDPSKLDFAPGYEASLMHSEVFRAFIKEVVSRLINTYKLRNKKIVEIGCGKGEFLELICEAGGNIGYGFDPSLDSEVQRPAGTGRVKLIPDYYDEQYASLAPDLICSLSVFEDIQSPINFLTKIREQVGDFDTIIYFEVFNGARALRQLSGWSVHYEQCNYWSQESLTAIFEKCGFHVVDAGTCYGDGEYLYVEATRAKGAMQSRNSAPYSLPKELANFSKHHDETVAKWTSILANFHESGRRVAVWGTGGKGIGFLNEIPGQYVNCVVDINPDRQQKFIPGSGHQIDSPESLIEYRPDVIIVTNPLYKEEIESQNESLGVTCEYLAI